MKILGIHHSAPDPSAAIICNNVLVVFAEEERFIRIKHAPGCFPYRAIDFVLSDSELDITDIDVIVFSWDTDKYDQDTIKSHYDAINIEYPIEHENDRAYQQNKLNYFRSSPQRAFIENQIRRRFGEIEMPEIVFVNHHFSHACTAYFNSGISKSLILTLDGSGEEISTKWFLGNNGSIEELKEIKVPHSLGWFYSAFTEYLGFKAYNGEYKVMGLAAYGEYDESLKHKIDQLIWADEKGGFKCNPQLMFMGEKRHSSYFSDLLVEHLRMPARAISSGVTQWHKDCAFAVQSKLEDIVLTMTKYWIKETGVRNICLAGGVAHNVKLNGHLFNSAGIEEMFVFPVSGDAGTAIGGPIAYQYKLDKTVIPLKKMSDVFLGPAFSDTEIRKILENINLEFEIVDEIERRTAQLISEGKTIGWFQGRMEAGPRALGARSILADPRTISSRDRINSVIKFREGWRPFCPSMTEDAAKKYLQKYYDSAFMTNAFKVRPIAIKEIPAVVHVDDTTRPQIISKEMESRFSKLIHAFGKISNTEVLLNTSFNIKGQPIVCTPQDALRTFYSTSLDVLVLGNCILIK